MNVYYFVKIMVTLIDCSYLLMLRSNSNILVQGKLPYLSVALRICNGCFSGIAFSRFPSLISSLSH
ncbi:hypothetical protein Hanom_Chr14g01251981 [Helianthus anomalus]